MIGHIPILHNSLKSIHFIGKILTVVIVTCSRPRLLLLVVTPAARWFASDASDLSRLIWQATINIRIGGKRVERSWRIRTTSWLLPELFPSILPTFSPTFRMSRLSRLSSWVGVGRGNLCCAVSIDSERHRSSLYIMLLEDCEYENPEQDRNNNRGPRVSTH